MVLAPLLEIPKHYLFGHDGEAGGEDDNPFDQVFQLLQVLQSKDISLTPNVNTFIAAKTW